MRVVGVELLMLVLPAESDNLEEATEIMPWVVL